MIQMESSSGAKRLWHIVRAVFYMLQKGLSKDKLMMDLHLLLKRGKIAGKALSNLITFHHHHHSHSHHHGIAAMYSGLSCRSMDPNRDFYSPKEIEFSCSNTPSYPSLHAIKRKNNRHRRYDYYDYDAAAVAKAFELLNSEISSSDAESVLASPSPAPMIWSFGKSPAKVRQLRVTDSPFPLRDEEEEADSRIDQEADEFIRRFYEQLRLQQTVPVTPEYKHYHREPLVFGRA